MLLSLRSLWEVSGLNPVFTVHAPGGRWTAWHSGVGFIFVETAPGKLMKIQDMHMLRAMARNSGATIRWV